MRRTRGYTNGVLTVIAVVLGLNVAVNLGDSRSILPAAAAQPTGPEGPDTGLISAAEQRKVMIAELRRLSVRMERIEAKLNSGLSVKVTEMPAMKKDEGDKGN